MIDSTVNNNITEKEIEELNEKADREEEPENAAEVIKQYEDIICIKTKNIICYAYHQCNVFKRFKDKEKFKKLVKEFKVHRSTTIFKINIFKLIDKHPKLMKSSTTSGFLKNYHKDIKQICKENSNQFE